MIHQFTSKFDFLSIYDVSRSIKYIKNDFTLPRNVPEGQKSILRGSHRLHDTYNCIKIKFSFDL